MSFFDSLRSFLGIPARDHWRQSPSAWNQNLEQNEEEDQEDDSSHHMHPGSNFGFRMFTGDILEMHRFFEQQFDEMLKSFHSNWFFDDFGQHESSGGGGGGLKMLPPPDEGDTEKWRSSSTNPRHKYLKPSYIQPPPHQQTPLIDREESESVPASRILDLFPDKGDSTLRGSEEGAMDSGLGKSVRSQPLQSIARSFTSQFVRKKVLPNGGVEVERRCVRDGEEEVRTVSRQLGDMKHSVTVTTRLSDGTTETHEEFINLNQDELGEFNKAWNNGRSPDSGTSTVEQRNFGKLPSLLDIFGKF